MLIVKRTIERKMTEEGKAKLSSLIRTNDFTLSTRGEEKRKVFKFSKQKFAEMKLNENAILVGQDNGKAYILVVPVDTPDAVLKGTKGKIKNQEFTYSDLVEILKPTEDRHGYNLVEDKTQVVDGVLSVWEIVPTELVRKSSKDEAEDTEDEPALYDASTLINESEEVEEEETWEEPA